MKTINELKQHEVWSTSECHIIVAYDNDVTRNP